MPRLEVRSGHRISKIAGGGGCLWLVRYTCPAPATPFPETRKAQTGTITIHEHESPPEDWLSRGEKNIQNVGPQSTNHCISVDVHVSVQRRWDNIAYYRGLKIYQ